MYIPWISFFHLKYVFHEYKICVYRGGRSDNLSELFLPAKFELKFASVRIQLILNQLIWLLDLSKWLLPWFARFFHPHMHTKSIKLSDIRFFHCAFTTAALVTWSHRVIPSHPYLRLAFWVDLWRRCSPTTTDFLRRFQFFYFNFPIFVVIIVKNVYFCLCKF